MLYRFSKDTAHDARFRREKLLDPLLRTVRGCGSVLGGGAWVAGGDGMGCKDTAHDTALPAREAARPAVAHGARVRLWCVWVGAVVCLGR
eukprot:46400-Chlamydomonas_euryale.AAC.2